jgi:transmembrane sensor
MRRVFDTPPDEFAPTEAMRRRASLWALRLRDDDGPQTRRAFEAWRAEAPAHELAFAEAESFLLPASLAAREILAATPLRGRPRWRPGAWVPLAACLAVAAVLTAGGAEGLANLTADAATSYAGARTVALEDGSVVTLNARSAIDVTMTAGERRVRLRRGEAYFVVAPNRVRPFVVAAGEARVRVVGTQFNVRLDDRDATVTVDKGVVDLSAGRAASLRLAAGAQGLTAHGEVERQVNFEPLAVSAWRRNRLVFYETPLSRVVAELNRHRRAPILVVSSSVRATKFSGGLDLTDAEGAVRIIEKHVGVTATHLPGGVTIIY